MMRLIWLVAGTLALITGIAGIVLPVVPTVPLLLLAAFCFARVSDRLHGWLVNHPVLGPPIRDWQRSGAISPTGKRLSAVSMLAVFALSVWLAVPIWLLAVQATALIGASCFIWTRPSE